MASASTDNENAYFVYVLRNAKGILYTGIAKNVDASRIDVKRVLRLRHHRPIGHHQRRIKHQDPLARELRQRARHI